MQNAIFNVISILPLIGDAVMEFENVARGFFHARVKSPTAMRQKKSRSRCFLSRRTELGFVFGRLHAKAQNFESV
jgi:hypothetical protein